MTIRFWLRYVGNRAFWFVVRPVRRIYAFVLRPERRTVKVLVESEDKLLLVRPNYAHRRWTLPGGKVERQETYENAARREILEETGLQLQSLQYIGQYENTWEFYRNTVKFFLASPASFDPIVDGIEIKEAGWFPIDTLPADRSTGIDRCLEIYRQAQSF